MGESILPPDRPHPSAFSRSAADFVKATLGTSATIAIASILGPWWGLTSLLFSPGPGLFRGAVNPFHLRRLGVRR